MAEYIEEADAICAEENEKHKPRKDEIAAYQNAVGNMGNSPANEYGHLADLYRPVAQEIRVGIKRLGALNPPKPEAQRVDALWRILSVQATTIEAFVVALDEKEPAKFNALAQKLRLNHEHYRDLAQGLGFKQCGQG
jgi:hypothetical protein